jgi:hypothetical protein
VGKNCPKPEGFVEPSTLHLIYLTTQNFPRDAFTNILDLISFVLVAPEIIGEERMDAFIEWLHRISVTYIILIVRFVAATIVNAFGFASGTAHFIFVLGVIPFIAGLFWLIEQYMNNTTSKRIMLVLGAMIFVCARMLAIISAFQAR